MVGLDLIGMISTMLLCYANGNSTQSENTLPVPQPISSQSCLKLLPGQYLCDRPTIDEETQNFKGCEKETQKVHTKCHAAPNITCDGVLHNGTTFFLKDVPCTWTNGYSFETSLILSIFLGMFGIDRFYLGYPAIGLLKFSTLGFFFLGQLIDIILIASQVVKPSDGSEYVIDYYGAKLQRIAMNNSTYLKALNEL